MSTEINVLELESSPKKTIKKKVIRKAKKTVKKVSKAKPKKFSVKGSFLVSPSGEVLSKTKSIAHVARGRKEKANEFTVSFIVKHKLIK